MLNNTDQSILFWFFIIGTSIMFPPIIVIYLIFGMALHANHNHLR